MNSRQHSSTVTTSNGVLPMTEVNIIDVEASGLHVESYPIEIAILIGGVVHSWLIKPAPQWQYWCPRAEGIHGISRDELTHKGLDLRTVANELNALMNNTSAILYSDADRWDDDWINTLYSQAGVKQAFHILSIYDLFEKEHDPEFQGHIRRLSTSGKYRRHRAGEDVQMIYEAYSQTVNN